MRGPFERFLIGVIIGVIVLGTIPGTAVAVDRNEPNDSQSAARSIPIDRFVNGEITGSDEDWFRFTASQGQQLTITLSKLGDRPAIDISLIGPQGNRLASDRLRLGETSVTLSAEALRSGTHYILITGATQAPVGYTVRAGARTITTDPNEPNNVRTSATPLRLNQYNNGEITAGDQDWFKFNALDGQRLTATLEKTAARNGLELALFGPGGQRITSAQVRRGETQATITRTAGSTGTYYLRVTGLTESVVPYVLRATAETQTTDPNEPNNVQSGATTISRNRYINGETRSGDQDWFRFSADAGETLTAIVTKPTRAEAIRVSLRTSGGTQLDSDRVEYGESQTTVTATVSGDGTYYLQIEGATNAVVSYTVRVSGEQTTTDRNEPNDVRSEARAITKGQYVDGEIVTDDTDWFRFSALRGQTLTTTLTKASNDAGLRMTLYDSDGDSLDSERIERGDSRGSVSASASSTGTYYVKVEGIDTGRSPYSVRATAVTESNDDNEPNDIRGEATFLNKDRYVDGVIEGDDVDWFRFSANRDQRLTGTLIKPTRAEAVELILYDSSGRRLDSDTARHDESRATVSATADQSGTYYLRVEGDTNQEIEYSIRAEATTPSSDSYEPNDRQSQARTITKDRFVSSRTRNTDQDWFKFSATANDRIRATITKASSASAIDITIVSPGGNDIVTRRVTTGTTQRLIETTVSTSGTYYLRITGATSTTVSYSARVSTIPTATDPNEPNNEQTSATPIATNTYTPGKLSSGDQDWFAFSATRNETIYAILVKSDSAVRMDATLYTSGGTIVDANRSESGSRTTAVETVATANGTYYVRVDAPPETTGDYRIAVTTYTETAKTVDEAIAGSDRVISLPELQQAIEYWRTGDPVPATRGETISLAEIQHLIRTWASGAVV